MAISSYLIDSLKTCSQNFPGRLQKSWKFSNILKRSIFQVTEHNFVKYRCNFQERKFFAEANFKLYFHINKITNLHFFFQERTHYATAAFTVYATLVYVSISNR